VFDVPRPTGGAHQVLVRVSRSLISAGTERSKVELGQSTLLQKARRRPEDVKKVLDRVRREGLLDTYKMVQGRLEAASPLGYSCAGTVEQVGDLVQGIRPGDRVACAGAGYANHAEFVSVPQNLCVVLAEGVDFDAAAFTTLGAIALQGFRQAGSVLGDRVAVIGLGLLGQLTVQIARSAGCEVIGVDLSEEKMELARQFGAKGTVRADSADAAASIMSLTGGSGADAVLITAASSGNSPIVLAGQIARDRANVVVVGDVRIDVPRSPFYEKELTVKLSRSYGPGRYDAMYEEYGVDYPDGYVRWTERANMAEFVRLLALGHVDVAPLTTHRFVVSDAPAAYDLVTGKVSEPFIGVLLEYPHETPETVEVAVRKPKVSEGDVGVSFIGAGNFVTATLMPALQAIGGTAFRGILTSTGLSAGDVAAKRGFAFATDDVETVLADEATDVVIVGTRHDTHAALVVSLLERSKHVYVEKPLASTRAGLELVLKAYAESESSVMVGFNRRFSPLAREAIERLTGMKEPRTIAIRVNAGAIPKDHWIQQLESGGGRIVGEMCHFVDLAACLAGSPATTVYAADTANGKSAALQDSLTSVLRYQNGSVATITYCADGDTAAGKELVEVMCSGMSIRIDDFRSLDITAGGKTKTTRLASVDKGHKDEMRAVVDMATGKYDAASLFAEAVSSSLATFAVVESLTTGLPVAVESVVLRTHD